MYIYKYFLPEILLDLIVSFGGKAIGTKVGQHVSLSHCCPQILLMAPEIKRSRSYKPNPLK